MKIGNINIDSNIILAPMAGYGDIAFRRLCRDFGAGLTVTEMVSVKGLCYNNENTVEMTRLADNEVPSAVQLFGGEEQYFTRALEMECLSKFDIIDINFGCPVLKVTKNGEGSALLKDTARAARIVAAAVKGAGGRAVTAKFRIGWDEGSINGVEFARAMEGAGAAALTVHGRTTKQMYSGVADWEQIALVAAAVKIPVLGNGDITDSTSASFRLKNSGCAGLAIGRGALGNPQIFAEIVGAQVSAGQLAEVGAGRLAQVSTGRLADVGTGRLEIVLRHIDYMLEYFSEYYAVRALRKHLPFYLKGVQNCKELKQQLNYITQIEELKAKLAECLG